MISNIYPVSLFCKSFIGAEYHEQKSTGYIITGLFKSCLFAKYNCMILDKCSFFFIIIFPMEVQSGPLKSKKKNTIDKPLSQLLLAYLLNLHLAV